VLLLTEYNFSCHLLFCLFRRFYFHQKIRCGIAFVNGRFGANPPEQAVGTAVAD